MNKVVSTALAVLLTSVPASTALQGGLAPRSATSISNADVLTILKLARLDSQISVADMGKYNIGVGILHRGKTATSGSAGVSAFSHDQVTEVYYIISGSGTLVTGGTMVNARPQDLAELAGPSMSGRIQNGQSRPVGPGDIVIIPPGVPHGFSAIDDHVDYLSLRVDADHVLPAGYTHPAIKSGGGRP